MIQHKKICISDIGTQYRSEIFYETEEQRKDAIEIFNEYNKKFMETSKQKFQKLRIIVKQSLIIKNILKRTDNETISFDRLVEKNIYKVKILDDLASPNSKRNAEEEYKANHIKNSIFLI